MLLVKGVDIMLKKVFIKRNVLLLGLVLLLACVGIAYAAGSVPQTASLSGTVVSTVSTGAKVSEGAVLVQVKTIAGTAPAARANCNGTVVAVSVAPGSSVSAGQVVAQIQP